MIVQPGIPDNLRWFADKRYGLFLHYGLYALLGRGEWVMYRENIPLAEYKKLVPQFNPCRFDADEWVEFAQNAGLQYIVFTAKHHDGFCMFDSALTDYKITNTPFGRDLMGELIDSCHRHNMPIIIYYSQPDWSHKNYVNHAGAFKDLSYTPEGQEPDWDRYIAYMKGQLEEICSKYGKIDGIFFDGSHKTREEWHGKEIYDLIKKYNPDAVVNDRARCGDYYTPERAIIRNIDRGLAGHYLLEICQSVMKNGWGYRETDDFYTPGKLIRDMLAAARIQCNFLLNAGPKPDGTISDSQKAVFEEIGKWIHTAGEGYIGSVPVELGMSDNFITLKKNHTLYVYMDSWCESTRLTIPHIRGKIDKIRLLTERPTENNRLPYTVSDDSISVLLPLVPPDGNPAAVAVDFDGDFTVTENIVYEMPTVKRFVLSDGQDSLCLTPEDALSVGYGVKGAKLTVAARKPVELADSAVVETETSAVRKWLTGWMTPDQSAEWEIDCQKDVNASFTLEIQADGSYPDCEVTLEVDSHAVPTAFSYTAGRYYLPLATLPLSAGVHRIAVRATKLKWGYTYPMIGNLMLKVF